MIKLPDSKKICLVFFIGIATVSCNGTKPAPPATDTSGITKGGNITATSTANNQMNGSLDTLWIEASAFLQLDKKLVFRFYIEKEGGITLHGWSSDDDVYKASPDVKLKHGKKSAISFGAGNYFGNLILKKAEVRDIIRLIKSSSSTYVIFIPQDPNTNNGQIVYDIKLTTNDPTVSIQGFGGKTISTGLNANPSPPKNNPPVSKPPSN